jgi:hypothetical protein
MNSKEWLEVMQKAEDYNPHMTPLIEEYGRLVLNDYINQPTKSEREIATIAYKEFENVGDEGLFPNHTDKDIWVSGFIDGFKTKLR